MNYKKLLIQHIFVFFIMLLAACDNNGPPGEGMQVSETGSNDTQQQPVDPDLSTTRMSAGELYRVSISSELEPLELNRLHGWTVHVETAHGNLVEDAEISVSGGMPEHNHGFPTAPRVTEYLGNGDYSMQGVRFSMPGWWEMHLKIMADGQSDEVVFNLILP